MSKVGEEKKIELTLKSLSFVDEIVVILDRSIDDTKEIDRKLFCSQRTSTLANYAAKKLLFM